MLHAFLEIGSPVPEKKIVEEFLRGPLGHVTELSINTLSPPYYRSFILNLVLIGQAVSEKKV